VSGGKQIENAYAIAKESYASLGVDTDAALERLKSVSISMHCWQGDDVVGFEGTGAELGSGLAVTGNYPGRARTPHELRNDLEVAYSLIPGRHRLNLHASYGEFPTKVDRDEVNISHFQGWIDWSKSVGVGLDFNPTYFAHPLAAEGFTLSHKDAGVRSFWVQHGIACRRIAASMGEAQGTACVNNVWIPDGYKDSPVNRLSPRVRLMESLDAVFAEKLNPESILDAVECKLFGIGSESYVVGSHEFYMGYAITRKKLLCLDAGHFHPTEGIADKISSVLLYVPELLLHVSRGVRWDSDHVVTFSDELQAITQEIVRGEFLDRTHIGLDYFDASINRIAAWVIGSRNLLKGLLIAMLEPHERMQQAENEGDYTSRLAMMEELKSMPFAAVWDFHCLRSEVPQGIAWLERVRKYESDVLARRH
jgi:L-rhamnose isomerase